MSLIDMVFKLGCLGGVIVAGYLKVLDSSTASALLAGLFAVEGIQKSMRAAKASKEE